MGKLNDSLLSGSSGRTGRLVVANVSGTEILRVRPRKRTGQPSAKQLLIQERMKQCYDFILPYKAFASLYFGYRTGMRSSYNQAITNLLNAFKLDFVLNRSYRSIPRLCSPWEPCWQQYPQAWHRPMPARSSWIGTTMAAETLLVKPTS